MKNITFLGLPYHAGQPNRGVKLAPKVFREMGLLKKLNRFGRVKDLGDLDFTYLGNDKFRENSYANQLISEKIKKLNLRDSFLLSLGGDHGLALGTVHGMLFHHHDLIVVWADAHGDINIPSTSPSGNFHGMPLAYLLGLAKDPDNFSWLQHVLSFHKLIYFGTRSLDAAEEEIIRKYRIQYYSSDMIKSDNVGDLIRVALEKADPELKCPIHLSLDIDLFDPEDVSSTGCLVPEGPSKEAIFEIGKSLFQTGRVVSMDLVELNPLKGSVLQMLKSFDLASDFLERSLE